MKTIEVSKEQLKQLYDKDYPLWVDINLQLLKDKAYELVDWDNLLEEIEDMGARHLEACVSYLAVILEHLYKLDNFKHLAGGNTAGKSWERSVRNARRELKVLLEDYPSLQYKLPTEIDRAWRHAVVKLKNWLDENDKNPDDYNFPQKCPYTYEEALNRSIED
ncbi:DUF29 domain-containing protein [Sulfurihydrogenibium sp.]|uniref:DUF29 domain-containing protein n=1 Tax=Sulfurihydrogenibium sp. TaxID=2053621 RepID=UPI002601F87C|nr:DUF29 domain-containing protein [Sulfurihydrogenibium sp.]